MSVITDYSNVWPYNVPVDPVPDYSLYERTANGMPAVNYDYIGLLSFKHSLLLADIQTNDPSEFVSIFTSSSKGTALYRVKGQRVIKIAGNHATGVAFVEDRCSKTPVKDQQGYEISVFLCYGFLVPPKGGATYRLGYSGLRNCLPLDQFTAKDGATGETVVDLTGNPMMLYNRNAPIPPGTYLLGSSNLNIFAINKIADCLIAGVEGYPQYSSFTKKVVFPMYPESLEDLKASGYDVTISALDIATFIAYDDPSIPTYHITALTVTAVFDTAVSVQLGDNYGESGEGITVINEMTPLTLSIAPPCVTSCALTVDVLPYASPQGQSASLDLLDLSLVQVEDFFTSVNITDVGSLDEIRFTPSKHKLSSFIVRGHVFPRGDTGTSAEVVLDFLQLNPEDIFDPSVRLLDRATVPNITVFLSTAFDDSDNPQDLISRWIIAFCDGYMSPSVHHSPSGTKVTLAMPIAEQLTPSQATLVATWCFGRSDLLFIDLNPITREIDQMPYLVSSSLGNPLTLNFDANEAQNNSSIDLDFTVLGSDYYYSIVGEDFDNNPLIIDDTGHVYYDMPEGQDSSVSIAWPYKNFLKLS